MAGDFRARGHCKIKVHPREARTRPDESPTLKDGVQALGWDAGVDSLASKLKSTNVERTLAPDVGRDSGFG